MPGGVRRVDASSSTPPTRRRGARLPSVARVFVAHPIQDRTDDEMRALADAAFDEIVARGDVTARLSQGTSPSHDGEAIAHQ